MVENTPVSHPQPIVLFGPQIVRVDPLHLRAASNKIATDGRLKFISELLLNSTSNLDLVRKAGYAVDEAWVTSQLHHLRSAIRTGSLPENAVLSSSFLAPWTVIKHAVDYVDVNSTDVQGFCIGFLTAAAVTSALDAEQLKMNLSKSIHLAVIIGAVVDAERGAARTYSIPWHPLATRLALERFMKHLPEAYISCYTDCDRVTVSVRADDGPRLVEFLENASLRYDEVGLSERYHLPQRRIERLVAACLEEDRVRLPDASILTPSIRSNVDGEIITEGNLSAIALKSILVEPCHWFEVVIATTDRSPSAAILQLGSMSAPRSLLRARNTTPGPRAGLSETPSYEPIAVVGMACRYPRAKSLSDLWQFLEAGGCAVSPLPKGRFDPDQLEREPKQQFFGNFIDRPAAFDHRFFSISGREAKSMDPQQRLALQVAYEAMEAAGYPSKAATTGQPVGCFLGVGSVDYEQNVASEDANSFSAAGTLRAFISGRISHHFGWTGPSITYDTACSSSAVAIHSACRALQMGECTMALTGGVHVITAPSLFQNLSAASFLHPSGASTAFDAAAAGYCRGEGAGLVLLKRLSMAQADNDLILGVLRASGINQGSNCTPITVPSSESQKGLYQQALLQARLRPRDISYVEAHGTGTPVGDPIEYESIRRTFEEEHRTTPVYVGSIKDNIGHTEGASGVAGLIKVLMMMQSQCIPKQANFTKLHHAIQPGRDIRIPISTEPWNVKLRAALVNNYGAAGSNATLIVHEHPRSPYRIESLHGQVFPFKISAHSEASLQKYAEALRLYVRANRNDISDLAFNLSTRFNREHRFSYVWTASDLISLEHRLAPENIVLTTQSKPVRTCVLCIGGQGGKGPMASRDLYEHTMSVQSYMSRCDTILSSLGLTSVIPSIFETKPPEDIVMAHAQLFVSQYVNAMAWIANGIVPTAVVGHSFGQITALCIAGAMLLEDALRLVVTRARLIRDVWGSEQGAMASLEGSRQAVDELLVSTDGVEVVCFNGPNSHVIAGATTAIDAVETSWKTDRNGVSSFVRLRNTHAYHSALTGPILPGLREAAETIKFRAPVYTVETCSPGSSWTAITADRIVEHTRSPVYFEEAVKRLTTKHKNILWLEIGSPSTIMPLVRRILKSSSEQHHFVTAPKTLDSLANTIVELGSAGTDTTFWPFHKSHSQFHRWLPLPPYQFEDHTHWIEYEAAVSRPLKEDVDTSTRSQVLVQRDETLPGQLEFVVNTKHEVYRTCVSGHAVCGQALCPASLYCELVMRSIRDVRGTSAELNQYTIDSLQIIHPLALSPAGKLRLSLSNATNQSYNFEIVTQLDPTEQTVHARGRLLFTGTQSAKQRFESIGMLLRSHNSRCLADSPDTEQLSGSIVYKVFGAVVDYADYYRGVRMVAAKGFEAIAVVSIAQPQPDALNQCIYSPVAMDNFIQVAGIHVNCLALPRNGEVYICVGIASISQCSEFAKLAYQKLSVYSNFRQTADDHLLNDIYVTNNSGDLLVLIEGARFAPVPLKSLTRTLTRLNNKSSLQGRAGPTDEDQRFRSPGTAPLDGPSSESATLDELSASRSSTDATSVDDGEDPSCDIEPESELMLELRKAIGRVLEIPVDQISSTASLSDLGIDSLLSSEIAKEIRDSLGVAISRDSFAALIDLPELLEQVSRANATSQKSTTSRLNPNVGRLKTKPGSSGQVMPSQLEISSKAPIDPMVSTVAIECFSYLWKNYDLFVQQAGLEGFCADVYPMQAQLVLAYVVEAFRSLGCDLADLSPDDEISEIKFSRKHVKVMEQYHRILETGELIYREGGRWKRTTREASKVPSQDVLQGLLQQHPQHAAEHSLLSITGAALADCLTEAVDPVSLIFQDAASRKVLQDVYTGAPMFKAGTVCLTAYLLSILESAKPDQPLRILEIGAGTGGTTSHLVQELAATGRKCSYTFTDISSSLVAAARKKFSKYDFMDYKQLNIEEAPGAELVGKFDVIISTNCIHATRDLCLSTANINAMLQPHGILCLVELTQTLPWFDLVFGLLEGWWLFRDDRDYALASTSTWDRSLKSAGFSWVGWTEGQTAESRILSLIVASKGLTPPPLPNKETLTFKVIDGLSLGADIYYPPLPQPANAPPRPIALLIHGGGHVLLSRHAVRAQQVTHLLRLGFLPVSIDYRLCPERTLPEGPMADVRDAWIWLQRELGTGAVPLARPDVRASARGAVAVGWSTGGHLALSLGWTVTGTEVEGPRGVLAFYCPSDYEDGFWRRRNLPRGCDEGLYVREGEIGGLKADLGKLRGERVIVDHHPKAAEAVVGGGWVDVRDTRSRVLIGMNLEGKHLDVLLRGMRALEVEEKIDAEQVKAVSPRFWIREGAYATPTFLIHGTEDDLIPWEQAQGTHDALVDRGVDANVRIVLGGEHLFDTLPGWQDITEQKEAVWAGYAFLSKCAGLSV